MGLLDKAFPSLPSLSGGAASTPDNQVSYSLADPGKLLNEGFSKVTAGFGEIKDGVVSGFKKLTSSGPSFKKIETPKAKEVTGTASSIKEETGGTDVPENTYHKVKLTASVNDGATIAIQNDVSFPVEPLMQRQVEFDIMPEITETRNAEYEALQPPQLPGEFQKYKGTKSTAWTITGMFTCRTSEEASRNYIYLNNLRGWVMPYFGENQRLQYGGNGGEARGKLGAPPPVLDFSGWRGLVGKVPVVITNLSWNWPNDCDWIPTNFQDDQNQQAIPFPVVMRVTINIVESFSAEQFNGFDLESFRNGRMVAAFTPLVRQESTATNAEPTGGNQGITNGTPSATASDEYSNEGRNFQAQAQTNTWTSGDVARYDRRLEQSSAPTGLTTPNPTGTASVSSDITPLDPSFGKTRTVAVVELNNLQAQRENIVNAIDVGKARLATNPPDAAAVQQALIEQSAVRDGLDAQIRKQQSTVDSFNA